MNNNKATESQKKLLMVLLMAVVFFSAYRFVYQPLVDETDALAAQNRALAPCLPLRLLPAHHTAPANFPVHQPSLGKMLSTMLAPFQPHPLHLP